MDTYIRQSKTTKILFIIFLSTTIVIFTELFYSQFIKTKTCHDDYFLFLDKKSKENKECEEQYKYEETKRDMYDLIIGISYLVSGFFLTKSNETIGYSLMVAGIIMDSKYTYNAYFHNNKQLLLLTSAINIGICFYIAHHFF
jgi:hypothetical protein